jgi:hypothetical protein
VEGLSYAHRTRRARVQCPPVGADADTILRCHAGRVGAASPLNGAPSTVVPCRAVAAEWTETIVTDHVTFEPGDRALEHYWLDR